MGMTQQHDSVQKLYSVRDIADLLDCTTACIYGYLKQLNMKPVSEFRMSGNKRVTGLYNDDQVEQIRAERERRREILRVTSRKNIAKAQKARSLQRQERQLNDELVNKYGEEGSGKVIVDKCDHFWMPYAYTREDNGDAELFMIYCAKCLKQRTFEED